MPTLYDYCVECGSPYAEMHEVFGGSNRNLSRLYGLTVRLCHEHHDYLQHNPNGIVLKRKWQKWGFEKFLKEHGSREDFIKLFGQTFGN